MKRITICLLMMLAVGCSSGEDPSNQPEGLGGTEAPSSAVPNSQEDDRFARSDGDAEFVQPAVDPNAKRGQVPSQDVEVDDRGAAAQPVTPQSTELPKNETAFDGAKSTASSKKDADSQKEDQLPKSEIASDGAKSTASSKKDAVSEKKEQLESARQKMASLARGLPSARLSAGKKDREDYFRKRKRGRVEDVLAMTNEQRNESARIMATIMEVVRRPNVFISDGELQRNVSRFAREYRDVELPAFGECTQRQADLFIISGGQHGRIEFQTGGDFLLVLALRTLGSERANLSPEQKKKLIDPDDDTDALLAKYRKALQPITSELFKTEVRIKSLKRDLKNLGSIVFDDKRDHRPKKPTLGTAREKREAKAAAKREFEKAERKTLKGTWRIVAAEVKGRRIESRIGQLMVFNGNRIATHVKPGVSPTFGHRFDIDGSRNPKAFTLVIEEKKRFLTRDRIVWSGIYVVSDDEMKLCYVQFGRRGTAAKRTPPTTFTSKMSFVLYTLKRVK